MVQNVVHFPMAKQDPRKAMPIDVSLSFQQNYSTLAKLLISIKCESKIKKFLVM
jgi:hypothetical protein